MNKHKKLNVTDALFGIILSKKSANSRRSQNLYNSYPGLFSLF